MGNNTVNLKVLMEFGWHQGSGDVDARPLPSLSNGALAFWTSELKSI